MVDVGSGAGLPGIPLAILRPDLEMTLLEPLLRRVNFLTHTVEKLGITNVQVVRDRAEDHHERYDVVTARAVAPLPRLMTWCLPLMKSGGVLLALKGQRAETELAEAGSRPGPPTAERTRCCRCARTLTPRSLRSSNRRRLIRARLCPQLVATVCGDHGAERGP